jgi:hypothetical protein
MFYLIMRDDGCYLTEGGGYTRVQSNAVRLAPELALVVLRSLPGHAAFLTSPAPVDSLLVAA